MGRTKRDSSKLDDKPDDSHVARTDQDQFGKIFRRNMPYGTITDHGTMFVGFSAEQGRWRRCSRAWPVSRRHARRAHALHPAVTGAYYFVPSIQSLQKARLSERQSRASG